MPTIKIKFQYKVLCNKANPYKYEKLNLSIIQSTKNELHKLFEIHIP